MVEFDLLVVLTEGMYPWNKNFQLVHNVNGYQHFKCLPSCYMYGEFIMAGGIYSILQAAGFFSQFATTVVL